MNNQQTDSMVHLVIENLHLLGYKVIRIDEDTAVLEHHDRIISIPTDKFMPIFHVQMGFLKHMLDKFSE